MSERFSEQYDALLEMILTILDEYGIDYFLDDEDEEDDSMIRFSAAVGQVVFCEFSGFSGVSFL